MTTQPPQSAGVVAGAAGGIGTALAVRLVTAARDQPGHIDAWFALDDAEASR